MLLEFDALEWVSLASLPKFRSKSLDWVSERKPDAKVDRELPEKRNIAESGINYRIKKHFMEGQR